MVVLVKVEETVVAEVDFVDGFVVVFLVAYIIVEVVEEKFKLSDMVWLLVVTAGVVRVLILVEEITAVVRISVISGVVVMMALSVVVGIKVVAVAIVVELVLVWFGISWI